MRSYNFTADMVAHVNGYVVAKSEEEAIKKIQHSDWTEIFDDTLDEPVSNIKITGYDDLD